MHYLKALETPDCSAEDHGGPLTSIVHSAYSNTTKTLPDDTPFRLIPPPC